MVTCSSEKIVIMKRKIRESVERRKNRERFISLMREAGWNQAETARQLRMTSSGVNQYLKRRSAISPMVMKLLEMKVHPGWGQMKLNPQTMKIVARVQGMDPELGVLFVDLCAHFLDICDVARALKKR